MPPEYRDKDEAGRREALRRIAEFEGLDAQLMGLTRKYRKVLDAMVTDMGYPPVLPTNLDGFESRLAAACCLIIRNRIAKEDLENALFEL